MQDDTFHYYRVFKNQTAVTRVCANDFKPVWSKLMLEGPLVQVFHLPSDDCMYYDYADKAEAMAGAKKGALIHIDRLIGNGELGLKELAQYRIDHYEDLNKTLLDGNIRNQKRQ